MQDKEKKISITVRLPEHMVAFIERYIDGGAITDRSAALRKVISLVPGYKAWYTRWKQAQKRL